MFKVTSVAKRSRDDLFKGLKRVSMLKNDKLYPYINAKMELTDFALDEVHPAQRYLLSSELEKVQHLEWELNNYDCSLFDIDGYLTITTDVNGDDPIDVLPPIVEAQIEGDGIVVRVINDGMHRFYSSHLFWKTCRCVLITGSAVPYYAYPIPEGWEKVEILAGDVVPAGYLKKWHRIADNKQHYRNFNSAFRNVGGPRGKAEKAKA